MFIKKLAHAVRLWYGNLQARASRYFVAREITKVLKLTHAQELRDIPQNEWPLVMRKQAEEIRAVASGQMDVIDRRTWAYPYLPEALHRLNQPILKNTPYNLRRFSETPIPRRAINLIKNAVLAFDWIIEAADDLGEEQDPNRELRIQIATESLRRPNNVDSFDDMLEAVLEDLIIGGYGCIEPRVTPHAKRPFKLWAVDGSTIRIFMDWTESTPDRPKYAQMTGLKGERGIVTFLADELIYVRDNVRTSTPFGLGKLEVAFNTVNAFLGAQDMASRAGSDQVHKTWLWWEQTINPGHIQTVRRHIINELEGQAKISLISGTKKPEVVDVQAVTPEDLLLDWQEFLIRIIANAFDISPLSLGLERDVNRNTGQVMADSDFRNAVVPMARRIEEAITRYLLHGILKWKDLKFSFVGLDDPDSMTKVQIQRMKYMMNAIVPDEIREEDDRSPLPGGMGRLTFSQSQAVIQYQIAKLTGKSAAAGGGAPGGGGGMGSGMGAGMGSGAGAPMGAAAMHFSAQDVAGMMPEEIEMYQELGLLPPTQQLGQQMEQEQPGILELMTDELRQFFQKEEDYEELTQVRPAPVTPQMEKDQQKRFNEAEHQESLAEATINRRGVFGPAGNQALTKSPFRGKYPRSGANYTPTAQDIREQQMGKEIRKQGKKNMRPGKGNMYQ